MDEKLIVVSICLAMVFFELAPMFRSGEKRLASFYTVLLSLSVVLFFLFDSDLKIPSLSEIFGKLIH